MKASQCATLAEYRREVLRCPQSVIASKAKVKQGWISQVELGHCPTPWKRDALLSAYKLTDREFVRMIGNASKLRAIQQPIEVDMPLFAAAREVTTDEFVAALRVVALCEKQCSNHDQRARA